MLKFNHDSDVARFVTLLYINQNPNIDLLSITLYLFKLKKTVQNVCSVSGFTQPVSLKIYNFMRQLNKHKNKLEVNQLTDSDQF